MLSKIPKNGLKWAYQALTLQKLLKSAFSHIDGRQIEKSPFPKHDVNGKVANQPTDRQTNYGTDFIGPYGPQAGGPIKYFSISKSSSRLLAPFKRAEK